MEHRQYYTFEEQELRRATWIWGLLSYGLPFSLIPALLFIHKNKFIHYHAKQGVVQFAFFLIFFSLSFFTEDRRDPFSPGDASPIFCFSHRVCPLLPERDR